MGFLANRISVLGQYLAERVRYGLTASLDPTASDVLVLLGGVGGWMFGPLMVRRALRRLGMAVDTVIFDWHRGIRGDLLIDLMWLKMNRIEACRLARRIMAIHRQDPHRRINVLAFSGGCGVAAFAMEYIKRPDVVDTLILLAPALSPRYNLGPALRRVRRCYAAFSRRDVFLLGVGTRLFGTMDRVYTKSAGLTGFLEPADAGSEDLASYDRLRQICWAPALRKQGHSGGHTAWINPRFLRTHLPALLADDPRLPVVHGWA